MDKIQQFPGTTGIKPGYDHIVKIFLIFIIHGRSSVEAGFLYVYNFFFQKDAGSFQNFGRRQITQTMIRAQAQNNLRITQRVLEKILLLQLLHYLALLPLLIYPLFRPFALSPDREKSFLAIFFPSL